MALTPAQVKERFKRQGLTLTKWAEDNGHDPIYAGRVLNGIVKGNFGKAHEIAVALGLKDRPKAAA